MDEEIIIEPFKEKGNERLDKINNTIKEPLPKLNQHLLISAPTGSGKSTIILNLLLKYLKFKWDRVIFFSETWDDDIYKDHIWIDEENIHTEYTDEKLKKIVEEQQNARKNGKPIYTLIIFDDFQELFYKGSYLENFLCKCRHYGITVWCCAQYIYAISKKSRQQFTAVICFPQLSKEEDLDVIAEIAPMGKKKYREALQYVNNYINETKKIHTFLFINFKLPQKYWLDFSKPIV